MANYHNVFNKQTGKPKWVDPHFANNPKWLKKYGFQRIEPKEKELPPIVEQPDIPKLEQPKEAVESANPLKENIAIEIPQIPDIKGIQEEETESPESEDSEQKQLSVRKLTDLIKNCNDIEQLNDLAGNDNRKTIQTAYIKRLNQLTKQ